LRQNIKPTFRTASVLALGLMAGAIPSAVSANTPVPALFGVAAPFFLSERTVGLVFVAIVALESVVLRFGLRLGWKKTFLAVGAANLVSSILGIFIVKLMFLLPAIAILPVVFSMALVHTRIVGRLAAIPLALIPSVCAMVWVLISWPEGRGASTWTMYISLIPALLLSVCIEFPILAGWFREKRLLQWALLANGVSYVMLAGLMLVFAYTRDDNPTLTVDYLQLTARASIHGKKPEKALQSLRIIRDLVQEHHPVHMLMELRVAKELAEEGYSKEAREAIEIGRAMKVNWAEAEAWSDRSHFEEEIREIEAILAKAESSARE